jgi:hypothetical protein
VTKRRRWRNNARKEQRRTGTKSRKKYGTTNYWGVRPTTDIITWHFQML